MALITHYSDKNKLGGYTWKVQNISTVRVLIKGTKGPCEYVIEVEEFNWLWWSVRRKEVCTEVLPKAISQAFEMLHDFFDSHDDFRLVPSALLRERNKALEMVKKYDLYKDKIAPSELEKDKTKVLIDGYWFNLPPLHEKMKGSQHVKLSRFSEISKVLSQEQTERVLNGEEIEIENVRLGHIERDSRKGDVLYYFDLISVNDEDNLSACVFEDDDDLYIYYDKIIYLDLSHPPYSYVKAFSTKDKPSDNISVGDKYNITLCVDDTWGKKRIFVIEFNE